MTIKVKAKLLNEVKENFESEIAIEVINELESYGDEWSNHLEDIIKHGCVSGTVGSLIYYNQTHEFHDTHEDEIDEIIEEYLDNSGLSLVDLFPHINVWEITMLKNYKAWFAFEQVAYQILEYIESDI